MKKKASPKLARAKQKRLSPDDRRKEFIAKLDAELLDIFIDRRIYELAASYRPDRELLLGDRR